MKKELERRNCSIFGKLMKIKRETGMGRRRKRRRRKRRRGGGKGGKGGKEGGKGGRLVMHLYTDLSGW